MVHPRRRGYVHRTALLYSTLLQNNNSSDLRTKLQISPNSPSCALSYRSLPSTLCALSCRGRPRTQLGLNLNLKIDLTVFALHYHHNLPSKTYLTPLHKCLFIQNALLQYHGLKNHGHPKTRGNYKRRGFDPTPKPLRLF